MDGHIEKRELLKRLEKEEKGIHITLGVVVEIGISEKTGWKQNNQRMRMGETVNKQTEQKK